MSNVTTGVTENILIFGENAVIPAFFFAASCLRGKMPLNLFQIRILDGQDLYAVAGKTDADLQIISRAF